MWWQLLVVAPAVSAFLWKDLEPPVQSAFRSSRTDFSDAFVNVRLDHFHAQNTDTFPMRYLYNDQFTRGNSSHIVIFVGGEWTITDDWLRTGLAYQLAETTGSGLFYTEHRYYGLTRPTQNTTIENLRYLTVDQALGDLAQFIQYIKSDQFENGMYRNSKVALIGCSYAGSMATWMRLGYPHVVDVAFSDSGPLLAQEDFREYIETMARVIREQGGQACYSNLETAISEIVTTLNTTAGRQQISELFNTCSPLSDGALDQVALIQGGVLTHLAYLVQYAVEGDVDSFCSATMDGTVSNSAMHRYAAWVRTRQAAWGQPCIETQYSEAVSAYTNTDFNNPATTNRLWFYQTCVEFGWYQTTTGDNHPFFNTIPLEFFHQACRDFYSVDFSETRLRQGINRTNLLWGALTHLPDHVITVQGAHDPWSPMGPTEEHATYLAPVYVLGNISHCRAIQSTTDADTELERVKLEVLNKLIMVLTGLPVAVGGATQMALAVTVALFSTIAVLVL